MQRLQMVMVVAVVMMTAACSSDEPMGGAQDGGDAIVLDVSGVAAPVTRAAQVPGSMNFTTLKATGFGVYGYKGVYNSSTSVPTLFDGGANTRVTFETGGTDPTTSLDIPGSWKYTDTSVLKEWETGQKYTFFAYAPYMSAGEGTAGTDAGINTISTGAGDPTIGYTVATDPSQSVDLLWGVRTDTKATSGLPWIDVVRGSTYSAVLFTFYHALCAIGLHAQVIVDQDNDPDNLGDVSQLGTIGNKDGCKITLRSITITPAGIPAKDETPAVDPVNFHQSGVLNLNNNTTAHQPNWGSTSGTIASLVLDDGTTAGHGTIDSKLLDPVANKVDDDDYYSSPDVLNLNGTQKAVMTNDDVPGVTESANTQTVIAADDLFMLIPQAAQDYTVTIQYYMTYKTGVDGSGNPTYHRQSLRGTATINDLTLSAGVKYYLNLVFGLTTFKLTVDAVDWDEHTINTTIATETGTSASQSLTRRVGERF